MAHRRGSFRGRSGSDSQRRKRLWADLNVNFDPLTEDVAMTELTPSDVVAGPGGSVAVAGFPSSGAPALLESTILRIRGYFDPPKSTSSGAGGQDSFAFGIGLVSEDAFNAAAVPNPASGSGLDWDGWMFLRSSTQVPLDSVGTNLDVKAMRKWESGMALVFVAGMETSRVAGLVGQKFIFSARGLFLLA